MPTDWKSLAKETVHSFDADDVRGMWDVDFRRATRVLLADHEDEIAAERRRWKRALRRTNAIVFGLAKRLAPPRRLVFALALLLTLLAFVESSFGGESFSAQASWAFFALFVSVLALAFLLAMELVDKLHFKDELVMARDLQAQLVPRVLPEIGAFELGAFNRIANTVGGDLYAFEPLPDGRLAVLFGDASGHGMAAGLVMAVTHAVFRTQLPGRSVPRRDDRVAQPRPRRDRERPLVLRRRLRAPRAGRRRDGDRRGPSARPQAGRGRAHRRSASAPAPILSASGRTSTYLPVTTVSRARRDAAVPFRRPSRGARSRRRGVRRRAHRAPSLPEGGSAALRGGRGRRRRISTSSWAGSPPTTTSRSRRSDARARERTRDASFASPGATLRRGGRAPVVDGRARDQARPAARARRRVLAVVRVGDLPRRRLSPGARALAARLDLDVADLRAHDPELRLGDEDDDGRERDLSPVHGSALRPRLRPVPPQGALPARRRRGRGRRSRRHVALLRRQARSGRARGESRGGRGGLLLRPRHPLPQAGRRGRRDSLGHRRKSPRGGPRVSRSRSATSRSTGAGSSSFSSSASSRWASATCSSCAASRSCPRRRRRSSVCSSPCSTRSGRSSASARGPRRGPFSGARSCSRPSRAGRSSAGEREIPRRCRRRTERRSHAAFRRLPPRPERRRARRREDGGAEERPSSRRV